MTADDQAPAIEHPALGAQRARRRRSAALWVADAMTAFAGSMRFAVLHGQPGGDLPVDVRAHQPEPLRGAPAPRR